MWKRAGYRFAALVGRRRFEGDPVAMAAAGALLILLTVVAAGLPARRAGRTEPAAGLRQV